MSPVVCKNKFHGAKAFFLGGGLNPVRTKNTQWSRRLIVGGWEGKRGRGNGMESSGRILVESWTGRMVHCNLLLEASLAIDPSPGSLGWLTRWTLLMSQDNGPNNSSRLAIPCAFQWNNRHLTKFLYLQWGEKISLECGVDEAPQEKHGTIGRWWWSKMERD